jgi:hypothetical protein
MYMDLEIGCCISEIKNASEVFCWQLEDRGIGKCKIILLWALGRERYVGGSLTCYAYYYYL